MSTVVHHAGVLTIGEAARHAGVTVRAVRHYHQRGLLPEPERDASGYRRYDAGHVVTLLRIRTLAAAGVPLARVAELLAADEEAFAQGLEQVDADLRREIARLQAHRRAVAALPRVEHLALPPEVVDYLDRLRGIGVSEQGVTLERDAWMILAAQQPDEVRKWIAIKTRDLEIPEFRELYLLLQEAAEWDGDDPRLVPLADRLIEIFDLLAVRWHEEDQVGDRVATLIDSHTIATIPALARLADLVEARGYTGWTNMTRVEGRLER